MFVPNASGVSQIKGTLRLATEYLPRSFSHAFPKVSAQLFHFSVALNVPDLPLDVHDSYHFLDPLTLVVKANAYAEVHLPLVPQPLTNFFLES